MGIDQKEAQRRRNVDAPKYSTKQPIAAIEKRVIDSPGFAKLPASAIQVLLLLARNLEKGRNGYIFLSLDDAKRHGVAKKTLYKQLIVLVAAGFIYQTARGGNGKCATYALTWLPVPKGAKDLYLDGFRLCAYRDHDDELQEWKKRRAKVGPTMGLKCPQRLETVAKNSPRVGAKNAHLVFNTNTHSECSGMWMKSEYMRLGLHDLEPCFQLPPIGTMQ